MNYSCIKTGSTIFIYLSIMLFAGFYTFNAFPCKYKRIRSGQDCWQFTFRGPLDN